MRTHTNRFRGLLDGSLRQPQLITRTHLVSARFEPTYSVRNPGGVLDLTFSDGDAVQLLPGVVAGFTMVMLPESTPLTWPDFVGQTVSHEHLDEIERTLALWLRAMTSGRRACDERLRLYVDDERAQRVHVARSYGWLCAAPYREVVVGSAPGAHAAARFSGVHARVVDDASSATGSLMLSRRNSVTADLGAASINALANIWYSTDIFGREDEAPPQVALGFPDSGIGTVATYGVLGEVCVELAEPLPTDGLLSFDPDDAPIARTFGVTVAPQPMRHSISVTTPPPLGGSTGRIALVLREDWQTDRDADGESAQILAQWLGGEGLQVTLCSESAITDVRAHDLLHFVGLSDPRSALRLARAAATNRIPTIVSAGFHEPMPDPWWASSNAFAIFFNSSDQATEERYLELFAQKRLLVDGTYAVGQPRHPQDPAALTEVLACVDEVLVATAAEASRLSRSQGRTERITLCAEAVITDEPVDAVDALVGHGEFVLCEASLIEHNNILHLARAARQADLRLVLSGRVSSVAVQAMLSEYIDEHVLLVPHATDAQRAGLYRRARVYVEPGFMPRGLGRVARALLNGCGVVVTEGSDACLEFGAGVSAANPLRISDMAAGLKVAWQGASSDARSEAARKAAAWANPLVVRTTVAQVYARAAARQASVSG